MEISGTSVTVMGSYIPFWPNSERFSCFWGAGLCVFLSGVTVKSNSIVGAVDNKIFLSAGEVIFAELQQNK